MTSVCGGLMFRTACIMYKLLLQDELSPSPSLDVYRRRPSDERTAVFVPRVIERRRAIAHPRAAPDRRAQLERSVAIRHEEDADRAVSRDARRREPLAAFAVRIKSPDRAW